MTFSEYRQTLVFSGFSFHLPMPPVKVAQVPQVTLFQVEFVVTSGCPIRDTHTTVFELPKGKNALIQVALEMPIGISQCLQFQGRHCR